VGDLWDRKRGGAHAYVDRSTCDLRSFARGDVIGKNSHVYIILGPHINRSSVTDFITGTRRS